MNLNAVAADSQPTFGCFDSNSQVVTCLVFKLKIPMSKHKFWGKMVLRHTTHNYSKFEITHYTATYKEKPQQ